MVQPINLAVLLSGGGTTLQNLLDRVSAGTLDARVRVVVSSKEGAYGLVRARDADIATAVVPSRQYRKDWRAMSAAVFEQLDKYDVDLVVMAGFMCFLHIPPESAGRVMNIHPALIPAFCGHGMYGHRVHEAVLEYGCKITGCTVHFADNRYDHGPIIIQKPCPVAEDDTPDSLAARVFERECEAYPEAIQLYAEDRIRIEGQRARILPPGRA